MKKINCIPNILYLSLGVLLVSFICFPGNAIGQTKDSYISTKKINGLFTLSALGNSAPILISANDFAGIKRVAKLLQTDIANVTNNQPEIFIDSIPSSKEIVLIGTLGKNSLIDKLVQEKKLDVNGIAGKWETFLIQTVENPFPNFERALVIVGSDKRGTIYGMFDLSEKIGVSPWYWWADVPVKKKSNIYIFPGQYTNGEPKVKYRGIFINDEAPALSGWLKEKYGSDLPRHEFYDHVFELILRLKGNYLWPAMWGRAIYDDDPESPKLADEYGVVIGMSHHEPMMRSHIEWQRYGKGGKWNYDKNDSALREFWRDGIKRMGTNESIITLGMRGDGDEPMSEESNVALLKRIITDQRKIIGDVTGKDVTTVPQLWALYKEVQDYYDRGMRVDDDITLLLCDDNWGNIRKLPSLTDKPRKGGYGIYYHFDYVGAPRNYKWLNTNQIERTWEQMHLAYEYGAKQIWIVNVGDIKPMEFPISFFLDYAWDPEKISARDLPKYVEDWSAEQFGIEYSKEIADIMNTYTKFNSRRKPELLDTKTYSLVNYREAETVVAEFNALVQKVQSIADKLPKEYQDAYFQLVLHPVKAAAIVNELYVTAGKNHLYSQQGRSATNDLAKKVKVLFDQDSLLSYYYNNILANGKWSHQMDQTHIGYTYWQQPEFNVMPKVYEVDVPDKSEMGVTVEGSTSWFPDENDDALLPVFDPFQQKRHYIEIFNRGNKSFEYSIHIEKPWIKVDKKQGTIATEERVWVSVDWNTVPSGNHRVPMTISGPNKSKVVLYAVITNPTKPERDAVSGFVESNGYVSIESENYSQSVGTWEKIPNLGRTSSAMISLPVTASVEAPGGSTPHLEYQVYLFNKGEITVNVYLSPTLDFRSKGFRYAVSIDDEQPKIVNIYGGETIKDWVYPNTWMKAVGDNIRIVKSEHEVEQSGAHTFKFWLVDPGVVLQKIVVETAGAKPSYLGPPQSIFIQKSK